MLGSKDGIQNLAEYSNTANTAMSSLMSSMTSLLVRIDNSRTDSCQFIILDAAASSITLMISIGFRKIFGSCKTADPESHKGSNIFLMN